MDVTVKTFGCKLNYYDSLLIKKQFVEGNQNIVFHQSFLNKKHVFVLNSCAVTAKATRDILKEATKIKSLYPRSFIVLTGCGAQVETNMYLKAQAIDLVVGNTHRHKLSRILKNYSPYQAEQVFKSNIFKHHHISDDCIPFKDPDRTRAFLKIQDGCNSFCTFCIIPFARGKSRSLRASFLAEEVKKLEEYDIKEVVLTGVHIGDYQYEGKDLADLIEFLLKNTKIQRIRLSSLEPVEITDKLLDCWQDERICPHFHISLQSTNSTVLKSMKRCYNQKQIESICYKVAKTLPQAFVGMDVIVGFPTESEKDFEESCKLLKNLPWTCIHVFPYSARKGTFAYNRYKPLEQKQVAYRSAFLRRLSQSRFKIQAKRQVGTYKKVLLFKTNNTQGLSRDYWKIRLPSSALKGEHIVFIEGTDDKAVGSLKGTFC